MHPELIERVIAVNYLGGVWCTRALLPGLEAAAREGGAHVVNLVSVAGRCRSRRRARTPRPSTPSSRSRDRCELRSPAAASGVHAVLPGFVETEGFPQKGVLASRLLSRFVIYPPRVARAIADAVDKGKGEVVVPWFPYRLVGVAQTLTPGLLARAVGRSDNRQDAS